MCKRERDRERQRDREGGRRGAGAPSQVPTKCPEAAAAAGVDPCFLRREIAFPAAAPPPPSPPFPFPRAAHRLADPNPGWAAAVGRLTVAVHFPLRGGGGGGGGGKADSTRLSVYGPLTEQV